MNEKRREGLEIFFETMKKQVNKWINEAFLEVISQLNEENFECMRVSFPCTQAKDFRVYTATIVSLLRDKLNNDHSLSILHKRYIEQWVFVYEQQIEACRKYVEKVRSEKFIPGVVSIEYESKEYSELHKKAIICRIADLEDLEDEETDEKRRAMITAEINHLDLVLDKIKKHNKERESEQV